MHAYTQVINRPSIQKPPTNARLMKLETINLEPTASMQPAEVQTRIRNHKKMAAAAIPAAATPVHAWEPRAE